MLFPKNVYRLIGFLILMLSVQHFSVYAELTMTLQLSGDGLCPDTPDCYIPNSPISVTLNISGETETPITAIGIQGIVPIEWTYKGISGQFTTQPSAKYEYDTEKNANILDIFWITPPSLPIQVIIDFVSPSNNLVNQCLTFATMYRLNGPQLETQPDTSCLSAKNTEGEGTSEGNPTEGQVPEGEGTSEGSPTEGQVPEGEGTSEGSPTEGQVPEGEGTSEGSPTEGQVPEGEGTSEGSPTEGQVPEGEGTSEGTANEGYLDDCPITNDLIIAQDVSGDAISTTDNNIYYIPGKSLTVTVTFTKTTSENILALGLTSLFPKGCQFQGVSPTNAPAIYPTSSRAVSNGINPFEFAWIDIPPFPFSFSFNVYLPSDLQGAYQITTQAIYREAGPQLCSNIVSTSFAGNTQPQEGEGLVEGLMEGFNEGDKYGCSNNTFVGCQCKNKTPEKLLKILFGDWIFMILTIGILGLTNKVKT